MSALGQCNGDNVIKSLKSEIESLKDKLTSTNERILSFCNKTDKLNNMNEQQPVIGELLVPVQNGGGNVHTNTNTLSKKTRKLITKDVVKTLQQIHKNNERKARNVLRHIKSKKHKYSF